MNTPIAHRYDFVYLFDCADGNPNGDPDAANAPRLDPQTMQGLVSDVCLKRKIRNFAYLANAKVGPEGAAPAPGYDLHVKHGSVLNENIRAACDGAGVDRGKNKKEEQELAKKRGREDIGKIQAELCRRFFDVRTFGSVLSTGPNAGQLRGPVQVSFSRSVDPVLSLDISITRVCGTEEAKNTEMGRKQAIAYGLYRCHGFISAHLAQQTGFGAEDLALLFRALSGRGTETESFGPSMMDVDVSAARSLSPQALIAFKHTSMLGNAPAHTLFERISVRRNPEVEAARAVTDYQFSLDTSPLPTGVEVLRLLWPAAARAATA